MVTLFLIFIDIIIPILIGSLVASFLTVGYMTSYIIYSLLLVIFSFIKGFYNNYYSLHFSEKLRISFITSITVVFFEMIYYLFYEIEINILVFTSWLMIPVIILLLRYIFKIINKSINDMTISIIGNLYKFHDYEIKILADKGFKIYFYNELDKYLEAIDSRHSSNNLAVINLATTEIQNELLAPVNTISLSEFMEKYLRKLYINDKANFININQYNKSTYITKRMIDYTAVLFLAPILIIVSIYIIFMKLINGCDGNFVYIQKRYGMNKNIFSLFKLRTMHLYSESKGNTVKNDQRIYTFAKFIRKYRLDEFPQIINILLGDMHLVGPRAEWVKLSDEYSEHIKNYYARNIVRPGITGWAQILYQYGFDINDSKQKLMYELYYIKNWSIWLELEICIKTISVILDKKGF
jgi:lipopolysaccharide/colanic/teichoic acid biosynthesis glycosyltransferase